MPTPAERRALFFLAGLTVLGVGVRTVGAIHGEPRAPADSLVALDRQRAAVESVSAAARGKRGGHGRSGRRQISKDSASMIDLDTASAASLRRLPHVGASLAQRIVADRDSLGPFGSLAGLARVRGVGCTMLQHLAPHVTFSASTRLPRGDGGSGGDADGAPCDGRRLRPARPP